MLEDPQAPVEHDGIERVVVDEDEAYRLLAPSRARGLADHGVASLRAQVQHALGRLVGQRPLHGHRPWLGQILAPPAVVAIGQSGGGSCSTGVAGSANRRASDFASRGLAAHASARFKVTWWAAKGMLRPRASAICLHTQVDDLVQRVDLCVCPSRAEMTPGHSHRHRQVDACGEIASAPISGVGRAVLGATACKYLSWRIWQCTETVPSRPCCAHGADQQIAQASSLETLALFRGCTAWKPRRTRLTGFSGSLELGGVAVRRKGGRGGVQGRCRLEHGVRCAGALLAGPALEGREDGGRPRRRRGRRRQPWRCHHAGLAHRARMLAEDGGHRSRRPARPHGWRPRRRLHAIRRFGLRRVAPMLRWGQVPLEAAGPPREASACAVSMLVGDSPNLGGGGGPEVPHGAGFVFSRLWVPPTQLVLLQVVHWRPGTQR